MVMQLQGRRVVRAEELSAHFEVSVRTIYRDIAALGEHCRFRDCSHTHEPGCAVQDAVETGALPAVRYKSYCRIRDSLDSKSPWA